MSDQDLRGGQDLGDWGSLRNMSSFALLKEIGRQFKQLFRKEVLLAKTEIQASMRREIIALAWLVAAGIAALAFVFMLLVTLVFALTRYFPGWIAGLIVSGALLVVSAILAFIGWSRRVKSPLVRTKEVFDFRRLSQKEWSA